MSLKWNLAANFAGQTLRAVVNVAFIPVYVRYMGIESYGVVGLYAVLLAWFNLLDIGMRPALGREMAIYTGGGRDAASTRALLEVAQWLVLGLSVAIALAGLALAAPIGRHLAARGSLAEDQLIAAVCAMAIVIAVRFPENLYSSALAGLQRQILLNAVTSAIAVCRAIGAVAVLVWVSPTVQAFFLWQALMSGISSAILGWLAFRAIPLQGPRRRPTLQLLRPLARFAGGVLMITVLATGISQIDKFLVLGLVPLRDFGYYSLAAAATGALAAITMPIASAYMPKLVELLARGDKTAVAVAYHQCAQLMSVLLAPCALALVVFPDTVVYSWTHDWSLVVGLRPVLPILALGVLLNGLVVAPHRAQMAYGWLRVPIVINAGALLLLALLIPALTARYGTRGAAWTMCMHSTIYLVLVVWLMHRSILRGEALRWYVRDLGAPLAGCTAVFLLSRATMPGDMRSVAAAVWVGATVLVAAFASLALAGDLRTRAIELVAGILGRRSAPSVRRS